VPETRLPPRPAARPLPDPRRRGLPARNRPLRTAARRPFRHPHPVLRINRPRPVQRRRPRSPEHQRRPPQRPPFPPPRLRVLHRRSPPVRDGRRMPAPHSLPPQRFPARDLPIQTAALHRRVSAGAGGEAVVCVAGTIQRRWSVPVRPSRCLGFVRSARVGPGDRAARLATSMPFARVSVGAPTRVAWQVGVRDGPDSDRASHSGV